MNIQAAWPAVRGDALGGSADPRQGLAHIDRRDLRFIPMSAAALLLYALRPLRPVVRRIARLEGGAFYSGTLRALLLRRFNVYVGAYSYGPCLTPGSFPAGVRVGRYVSIGAGVRIFLRNHPLDRLSLHPFFYNASLGVVPCDNIQAGTLSIGHDAWIGERAIFTPGCTRVGIGSVVGAGAVVTKDVPDFAVVVGNPAKVIRMRFDDPAREQILSSRWWERSVAELTATLPLMVTEIRPESRAHPLLRGTEPVAR